MVVAATVVTGLIIAVGLLGTLVPALPGSILVLLGVIVFGAVTGWDAWAIGITGVAALVTTASMVLGVRIPAKATGATASKRSLRVGILGGVVGFFVIPVVGLPVGWITGVFLSEAAASDSATARRSTLAVLRSFGAAALVQFGLALSVAVMWGVWATVEVFG
jgi:uncharacterized protein YqgC (DUF456 family)